MSDLNTIDTIDAPKLQELPPGAAEELMREIEQIPREYWPNLLQIVRVFKETVALKPEQPSEVAKSVVTEMSREERIQRNQAAIELLRSWREEGDEQEQTETWEFLRQALEENPVSI